MEEVQTNVDIKSYNKVDVPLMRIGCSRYKMQVQGLAESCPSYYLRGESTAYAGVLLD
jgi:hypothetical protein